MYVGKYNRMKKLKEERVSRDDIPNADFGKFVKTEKTWIQRDDKFDEKAQIYWQEMFGLLELLNFNNKKYTISSVESPIITNYLLWRLLNEIKQLKKLR